MHHFYRRPLHGQYKIFLGVAHIDIIQLLNYEYISNTVDIYIQFIIEQKIIHQPVLDKQIINQNKIEIKDPRFHSIFFNLFMSVRRNNTKKLKRTTEFEAAA